MERDPAPANLAEAAADLDIVRAALRGDELARCRLADRLADLPALLRAKHRRLGSPLASDQLEDVTQNVLLALWRKLPRFDGRVPLPAWALGFGTFELLRAAHALRRAREQSIGVPEIADPRGAGDLDTSEQLAAMLARLAPQDLQILQHKHIEGRTFAEIAAELRCPPASVKTRYYRALEAIRRRLPGQDGERP